MATPRAQTLRDGTLGLPLPKGRDRLCALCGEHARHDKSPALDLRGKPCPRFPGRLIHRGCCAKEPCSIVDGRGHVRCGWEAGGKERLAAHLHALEGRGLVPTSPDPETAAP